MWWILACKQSVPQSSSGIPFDSTQEKEDPFMKPGCIKTDLSKAPGRPTRMQKANYTSWFRSGCKRAGGLGDRQRCTHG